MQTRPGALTGFFSATFLCLAALFESHASAQEPFAGSIRPFTEALDAGYPDDHLNFTESSYSSESSRAAKAARLSIAQIMLLDEVLQASEDDRACAAVWARDSDRYNECTSQLYQLPTLLISLNVHEVCSNTLAIPDRVTCLLLLETKVRGRRSQMQTHPTWSQKRLELDKRFAKIWYDNGQPDSSTWHVYPEARELANLDSLLLYVHALDLATATQAAAIYNLILSQSDPYVLGVRAQPPFPQHDLSDRNAQIQNARNRLVLPWRMLPSVSVGTSWESNYSRWIYQSRFAMNEFGMGLAEPKAFNLRPPQNVPTPDFAELRMSEASASNKDSSELSNTERPSQHTRLQPVLWVRGGVPVRIPPSSPIAPPVTSAAVEPAECSDCDNQESPAIDNEKTPVIEIEETDWPPVLMPYSLSRCEIRWEPFRCSETKLEDVIVYEAEIVNETLGMPAFVAQASKSKTARLAGKRVSFVTGIALCGAHLISDDVLAAAGACFELVPGLGTIFALNPRWENDLPGLKRQLKRYEEEARAQQTLREFDELIAGQREFERNALATREIQSMAESSRE